MDPSLPSPPSGNKNDVSSLHSNTRPNSIRILNRNLRLVDLDIVAGCPDITPQTFSPRNAAQTLTERRNKAEWILSHFYTICQPAEAERELNSLFPALTPLQSANLRSVLYKWLVELKRRGNLDQMLVLRKSLLDDCGGEAFEELLAKLSNFVAKSWLTGDEFDRSLVKREFQDGSRMIEGELRMPLLISYQVSLRKRLMEKRELRRRIEVLDDKLHSLEILSLQQLQAVNAELELLRAKAVPQRTIAKLHEHLEGNWRGQEDRNAWANILTQGDEHQEEQQQLDFKEIWRRTIVQGSAEIPDRTRKSRLLDLEKGAQDQISRLSVWKTYT